jgi:Coenzyme PQQ synthesis protein D (PqqD)
MADFELLATRTQERIECAPYDRWPCPDGTDFLIFYRIPNGYVLRFPDLADFEIAADSFLVRCTPVPSVPEESVVHLYRNQVLPLILSKKGKLVLHGSAVETDGFAVAFLGASGRGKSTLAASFAVDGCPFLTDDGLVLERANSAYLVIPSHPSLRLWEDSRGALLPLDTPTAPPVHYTTKCRFVAGSKLGYCNQSRLLRAMYFLGEGQAADIAIQRLNPATALNCLIQHSFILDVEDRPGVSAHFDRLSKLANEAACFHLDYPRCYETLLAVLRAIRAHAANQRLPVMKLADKIIVSPQTVARKVGNEAVILDLVSGNYFGLDPVGARMWQLMETGTSLAAVCDALVAEYDVSREALQRDVLALAGDLVEKKLVSVE